MCNFIKSCIVSTNSIEISYIVLDDLNCQMHKREMSIWFTICPSVSHCLCLSVSSFISPPFSPFPSIQFWDWWSWASREDGILILLTPCSCFLLKLTDKHTSYYKAPSEALLYSVFLIVCLCVTWIRRALNIESIILLILLVGWLIWGQVSTACC